ncbi:hypothetical protein BGZ74_006332 [Mortierella antarctica]|nr:hypothetical protein BGZ74_006332 [Mortierella antarctica]
MSPIPPSSPNKATNNGTSSSTASPSYSSSSSASLSPIESASTSTSLGSASSPQRSSPEKTNSKDSNPTKTPSIPSHFVTLVLDESQDIENDDDDNVSTETTNWTHNETLNTGPYLTTTTGHRSLSTPNLHADNSLIVSPANSPPASPALPAIASVTDEAPSLALGPNHSTHADSNSQLVLSPLASPESSPKLRPRNIIPMTTLDLGSPLMINGLKGAMVPPMNSQQSNRSSALLKAPVIPEGTKTLRSSKKRSNVNRHSVASLFDTGASSVTLPTNFARKGSLPHDSLAAAKGSGGLAGLFSTQQQDLTSTPFSLTLAEFRLNDIYPRRQRRLLTVLHRMDHRLRKDGVVKKLTKEQLKGKPDKEILKPDRKSLNKDYSKKGGQGGFMAQKIPAFLRTKKSKKRTRPVILHNIEMAIRDKKPELALQYISLLPTGALKKKKKKSYSDLNHCMLLAMIYRMERVAIELVDRGFPIDVNYPIIGKAKDEYRTKSGRTGPFEYPSYFIVAVGLGMCNLVKAMIKNANLNQSWCGLTPLLLATTLNECTNATCPPPTLPPAKLASMLSKGQHVHLDMASQTLIGQLPSSFNKSTNTQFKIPGYAPTSPSSIVATLLEYGADPNQGITLQQYLWANKLKGMGVLRRRRRMEDPKGGPSDNPIEYYIAARRHESGRQWLSHDEIRARKLAKAEENLANRNKKRFSSEMQEFWKGKSILPVELAIASGNWDCARAILQRLGHNSLKASSFGLLLQNDVMLTLSLIKSGSPVSQHDLHGCTPLHLAARRGDLEMVMVLLQLGGDVNSRGERQWTPLHESISQKHTNISSLLVACGADIEAKNDSGETPEELGRRRGLSAEDVAEHLDASKAKNCSAGLVHSFSSSIASHVVASATPSRRTSHEQLTANTLKSLMMSSDRQSSIEHSRLSQQLQALSESNNQSKNHLGHLGHASHGSVGGMGHSRSDSRSQSPMPNSLNNSTSNLGGHIGHGGQGSGANTPPMPSSSSSVSSSPTGSRSSNSDKKKKMRGFLKNIFK